ncbi:hypothetical protein SNOG_12590 [Parastagonospora nodorum SN15]|uniref:Heterokaryon incompatibility domain-containing protein n=1 Tax=Phaeosphaeria nodorum (strain SN15 / ATCC MYA-4574 / FGSC 10173) TaxID=321614 RepID=Q0U6M4_PHANO|nr:hypothetical protein SNOG_12590 [Parastagonospora nodorum SN15]EAT79888.1 hypothetical protein SNOG_12590 [Parastagonospora nodorum SN15]
MYPFQRPIYKRNLKMFNQDKFQYPENPRSLSCLQKRIQEQSREEEERPLRQYYLQQGTTSWTKAICPARRQEITGFLMTSRPWWRRVWVIQEATLPKQDPVMQCGRIEIKYRRFLESAKHCMFQNAPSELSRTQISLTVHGMFDDGHNPLEVSLANRLLAYLSCMSGNFEVTDPKDRINGVHGFLQSGPSNVEGLPSWVPMWESKKWIGRDKNHGAPENISPIDN